ncbi:hypothetical protein ACIQB5_50225, partial [Streptomyces sp. NPDC088560]|uniref:hypothetical protein n=1 Tax=Streptomyces sp. NPDC088560 TaxID=3365868 RepID=UPI003809024A
MEIATVRRTLNHTLTELKRALDNYEVAPAADLYALAWQQAAGAPPSERAVCKCIGVLSSPERVAARYLGRSAGSGVL